MTQAQKERVAKLKEQANKLKEKEMLEVKKEDKAIVANDMKFIESNKELAEMYKDSANVGAENLSGELPLLKVHQVGKSTTNELEDGNEPNDGWFFYKPKLEQLETIKCHILTISRGFRAKGIEKNGEVSKPIFNQIVSGVIINDGKYKPFMLFLTGKKLSKMWEFGKRASKYTHKKPIPIPMFALTVNLTTFKEVNSYGKSWLINFDIEMNEEGKPVLIGDPGEFQYLKDSVETMEEAALSLIKAKEIKIDNSLKEGEEVFQGEEEAKEMSLL